jgi:hypothetical protein
MLARRSLARLEGPSGAHKAKPVRRQQRRCIAVSPVVTASSEPSPVRCLPSWQAPCLFSDPFAAGVLPPLRGASRTPAGRVTQDTGDLAEESMIQSRISSVRLNGKQVGPSEANKAKR